MPQHCGQVPGLRRTAGEATLLTRRVSVVSGLSSGRQWKRNVGFPLLPRDWQTDTYPQAGLSNTPFIPFLGEGQVTVIF